jgi:maleate cis-trans isomerase
LITDLEESLGMQVITSNQVLVRQALRTLGIMRTVGGYGRLLGRPGA